MGIIIYIKVNAASKFTITIEFSVTRQLASVMRYLRVHNIYISRIYLSNQPYRPVCRGEFYYYFIAAARYSTARHTCKRRFNIGIDITELKALRAR